MTPPRDAPGHGRRRYDVTVVLVIEADDAPAAVRDAEALVDAALAAVDWPERLDTCWVDCVAPSPAGKETA